MYGTVAERVYDGALRNAVRVCKQLLELRFPQKLSPAFISC